MSHVANLGDQSVDVQGFHLILEVQPRLELREHVDAATTRVADRGHEPTAQRGECAVRGAFGSRRHQRLHRLRLGQVEPPVEERAEGELPGPREPYVVGVCGVAPCEQREHALDADAAAVAVDLDDVLRRVRPGREHREQQHFVDDVECIGVDVLVVDV